MYCRSCTAHGPRRRGSALLELHCPLPPGSRAAYCRSSTARCPPAVRQGVAGVPLPTAPPPPPRVGHCVAGLPLPTAPMGCGSALQELHCPVRQGSKAAYCRSSTAAAPTQCGGLLRGFCCPLPPRQGQYVARVTLPIAPRWCGRALHEFHRPLPPGSEAVYCWRLTAHCPHVVRRCVEGVPHPLYPRQ